MNEIFELLKIIIPAAVVLYAMYLTIRSFLQKEMDQKLADLKLKNAETVLPIRLQAYERMCLFLERISPSNILLRTNQADFSAKEYQQLLLMDIRNEFNHNLSQQLYVSDAAWSGIIQAKESVITLINECTTSLGEKGTAKELARKMLEEVMKYEVEPSVLAIRFIKKEMNQLF